MRINCLSPFRKMIPELVTQRKQVLLYNEERSDLVTSLCAPLRMYLDTEFFTQGFFILNTQGQCEHYSVVSTNLKFLKSYLFAFNDNGKSFTQAIRETPPDSYSYFLWRNHEECPLIQLKRTCDSLKGLVIYKRFGNTIEFWEFSGKNSAAIPNSISRSSLMPFLNFITYFNEHKASNQLVSPSAAFPCVFH